MESKKRPKKKTIKVPKTVMFILGILIIVGFLGLFVYLTRIESITVEGNFYADRTTVIEKVFTKDSDYRLLNAWIKSMKGVDPGDAFESCEIRITGLHSAKITVRETDAVADILWEKRHVFLNEKGVVLGKGTGNADGLPVITGLSVESAEELEKIVTNDDEALLRMLKLPPVLNFYGLRAKEIYHSDLGIVAVFDNIRVVFGSEKNLMEKAAELSAQFSHFKGLKGIMHLESYDSPDDEKRFFFEVIVSKNL